ncbi:MAG TPA: PVC-type heme-binding CxxCH protein [Tepidisphaeraceae bacterium]|jgi:putative membrane-bound dehydrogenase-like protein
MKCKRFLLLSAVVAGLLSAAPGDAQLSPEKSLETFRMADGFQAAVWASEPGLVNPTNLDIDERGRAWVLEAANYRASQIRPEGDRILILEDTHHTGHCDSYKVFVQDKRLNAPLGICKLGNKLFVSQSPNVFVYTIDEATDKPAGEPQVLFTGFEGVNHDHGVHKFVFGPDGRLYFNCGNEGGKGFIKYGDGKPVIDIVGSEVGEKGKIYKGKPKTHDYSGPRQGLVLSCDPDGSKVETYAYNFRNNFELCVDSFGTVWQSDNDDDGNQGCRINYVMEGGDFGYTGPRGSNWMRDRSVFPGQTKQEAHWHQHWPGVVPDMLHTGQGAPCGIVVYESNLFGDRYFGALFHADAGPNVVRAYITTPSEHVAKGIMNRDPGESLHEKPGAGYQCDSVEIMKSSDHWARPDDVCVAPDGSVLMADWYDPGVGGHATGDIGAKLHDWHKLTGRIFRFYPEGKALEAPKLDLSTVEGQVAALESPNQATRFLAYQKLAAGGPAAEQALKNVFENEKNPRFRARALWLLARTANGKAEVERALEDKDPDIRVTAIRAARRMKMDIVQVAERMLGDASPAVLRELCLAMRFEPDERAIPLLVKLADKYDGTDRWYLEAFGIGARDCEAQVLAAWKADHQNKDAEAEHGIEWRLKREPVELHPSQSADAGPAPLAPKTSGATGSVNAVSKVTAADSAQTFVTRDGQTLPPMSKLALLSGDAKAGEAVFRNANGANCIRCHQIGDQGGIIGPPLNQVGQKLNKAQLYEAILYPSAAIEMGYETWVVKTRDGEVFTGRKMEDTDDHVTILDADGKYHDLPAGKVDRKVQQKISIMPEGLTQAMTRADLVNLVEFLSQRR